MKQKANALQQRIEELGPWFHNMRLEGVETAPQHFLGDYPEVKYRHFREVLPADMNGLSVLDIGCNAGFYSLEMKRRGAARVLGIDTDEHYLRQARFAAEVTGLDIAFERMTVWEIGALAERFDLVLFMGVFYHLRHPLLALDLIHEHVASDLLVFQSMERGRSSIISVEETIHLLNRHPSMIPDIPRCTLSSIATATIPRIGGYQIRRVWRRCCGPPGLPLRHSRKMRPIFAVGGRWRPLRTGRIASIRLDGGHCSI